MMKALGLNGLGQFFGKDDRVDALSSAMVNYTPDSSPRPSGNMFYDQARFMAMSGHKPTKETFDLYMNLIEEELQELKDAIAANDEVKIFDALCDLHVVVAGAGVAKRYPMQAGMNEVFKSNFTKFDSKGTPWSVREDGKVLKDYHFVKPDLLGVMLGEDQSPKRAH